MGQHNIDKEFGQKLRDREITPKADSWEKLNARLENDNKRSGSYKWILGIAASFVAGILILGQVYRTNMVEDAPAVVDTPEKIEVEVETFLEQQNSMLATEEEKEPVEEKKIEDRNTAQKPPVPKMENIVQVAYEVEADKVLLDAVEEKPNQNLPVALEDAIAAVSSGLAENNNLAEAEADSLLLMAAARISRERTTYVAGQSLDAESLLWDVEMEMEQSFREKVFDLMKEGYLKARTAVANRNY
ncbi:hypothetical protein FHG64_05315 [Antarcticibacterium flavum]|uniref:Uncharacterized protein n=1 Tax=Antarcticibacterium flavum TaxID=2058175 RepID=A0A5B7X163_9FLAO|nr:MULTISPECIES: hypothetical protein [Antarcticibacterium]MCM4159864.1 hypothetical protein [Antarcticibacterium sp. W02-3]QCY68865.1 hypothetical protein FHG64_05315 [Antarcticibacterium flavum]